MLSTEAWMNQVFSNTSSTCYKNVDADIERAKEAVYMIVPCKGDKVEIPVFLLRQFADYMEKRNLDEAPDYLSVSLGSIGKASGYSSFDRIIRSVLQDDFTQHRLVKFQGKDGDNLHTYYGTKAALFDSDFTPLMICAWEMERKKVYQWNTDSIRNWLTRPIMRISPHFFIEKQDNVGRFVNKKMLTALVQRNMSTPRWMPTDNVSYIWNARYTPKVVIDAIPFQLKKVDAPSISTTNDCLLQLASEHLNDIV